MIAGFEFINLWLPFPMGLSGCFVQTVLNVDTGLTETQSK